MTTEKLDREIERYVSSTPDRGGYSNTVPINEIDRFIAVSARPEFAEQPLIVTSKITRNAENTLVRQPKPSPLLLGAGHQSTVCTLAHSLFGNHDRLRRFSLGPDSLHL